MNKLGAALAFLCLTAPAFAHPMPSSALLLGVRTESVEAEVQLPLSELGLALKEDLLGDPEAVLAVHEAEFRAYLPQHVRLLTPGGDPFTARVDNLTIKGAEQTATGPYQNLVARMSFTPPARADARSFTLHYDAIIHQVVTHTALVSVRQDWAAGVTAEQPVQVGVVRMSPVDGSVAPLAIDRSGGSLWTGFVSMVRLGARHIAAGTDHLLFLFTLLLPAPLLAAAGRWGAYRGTRGALLGVLKIVTAFTVGHSLTLVLGTVSSLSLPTQPIEAAIALSILVSVVHALRPVFPNREVLVAGGFGLVHGLAFSFTLAELNLNAAQTALSLLGFNFGIELVQVLIIALTLPWLLLLARTPLYPPVRVAGAAAAALAALGWFGERVGLSNPLGAAANALSPYAPWLLAGLAGLAVAAWLVQRLRRSPSLPTRS